MSVTVRSIYERHGEKARFLVTGVFNTAFGYALFLVTLALTELALDLLAGAGIHVPALIASNHFLIAQWTAWVLSVPVGTWTMKRFAFRSDGRFRHEVGRAYLVYLPTVVLNSAVLAFAVHALGLPPALGQLMAIGVAVIFSYLGHKYFTFRQPGSDTSRGRDVERSPSS